MIARIETGASTLPRRQARSQGAPQIRPQIDDDQAPAGYYRALRDVAAWMPRDAILSAEGAGTMDIGLTQLPSFNARSCLNAGTYGTVLCWMPPLVVDESEISVALDAFADALKNV